MLLLLRIHYQNIIQEDIADNKERVKSDPRYLAEILTVEVITRDISSMLEA